MPHLSALSPGSFTIYTNREGESFPDINMNFKIIIKGNVLNKDLQRTVLSAGPFFFNIFFCSKKISNMPL